MSMTRKIQRIKQKLIKKARRKGIWENFGKKEVRKLLDELSDIYGKDRQAFNEVMSFSEWCMNFDLSQL